MSLTPNLESTAHTLCNNRSVNLEVGTDAFRRAFEDAPIGMALVSVEAADRGRFLRVNRAMSAVTGYSETELLGVDFQSITHPDDVRGDLVLMDALLSGEMSSYQLEKRYTHAQHHSVWALVTASLVRGTDGLPLYAIRQLQDISSRKQVEGQLEYLADNDPLTGLYNRRRFARDLTHQLDLSQRYGGGGALVAIDLDHLKLVNDTFGHSAGDELIGARARILSARSRSTDVVGRLGGDEFALTLPRADKAQARRWADRFLHEFQHHHGLRMHPLPKIGASIGIVAFDDSPDASASDLQVCADLAMYEAKRCGGNRVALYGPELDSTTNDAAEVSRPPRLTWPARIRKALHEDAFVLYAQPIFDLKTNRVSQHEMLLRLPLSDGEVILPASFIYTAERFGLVGEIDRWVISHAILRAAAQPRETLAINLSADSICDPTLADFIESELTSAGADAHDLVFEVTETAAISNVAGAQDCLTQLIGLGSRIALDDFGAGFGSFHHLKQLPLQFLKIDGEFIRNLAASRTDRIFVRSMVELAHGLGQLAIAEHVENPATLELVRQLGADLAQGNFLGPARPFQIPNTARRGTRHRASTSQAARPPRRRSRRPYGAWTTPKSCV